MSKSTDSSDAVRRWRREGQIFSVHYQGEDRCSEWATAFWFAGANVWLEGKAPVELIDFEPIAVVTAASHARDKIGD